MTSKNTCPVCGGGSLKKVKGPFRTKYNGQAVLVPHAEFSRCSDCQEQILSPEQARGLSVQVKNSVREMYGLLAPEKIVAIRQKLRLTQPELEELFGQGPKVVTRWETGRVIQSRNADTMLRLLDQNPEIIEEIRKIEKAREKAQRKHSLESHSQYATV